MKIAAGDDVHDDDDDDDDDVLGSGLSRGCASLAQPTRSHTSDSLRGSATRISECAAEFAETRWSQCKRAGFRRNRQANHRESRMFIGEFLIFIHRVLFKKNRRI